MKRRTNFDVYPDEQLKDPDLADQLKKAGEAWEATLRSGIGRKTSLFRRLLPKEAELARRESRSYEPASAVLARIQAERDAKQERKATQRVRARNRPKKELAKN